MAGLSAISLHCHELNGAENVVGNCRDEILMDISSQMQEKSVIFCVSQFQCNFNCKSDSIERVLRLSD